MRQLATVFCLLFFFACQKEARRTQSGYFDTKGFFTKEASRLKESGRALNKKLILGTKEENVKLDKPDWNKELSAFAEMDLLLPGYNGKFSVDTINASNGEFEILYKREDPKLLVSEIRLAFNKESKLRKVFINMNNRNSLYKSNKELIYYTDSAYSIKGSQDIKLLNGASYEVEAWF